MEHGSLLIALQLCAAARVGSEGERVRFLGVLLRDLGGGLIFEGSLSPVELWVLLAEVEGSHVLFAPR